MYKYHIIINNGKGNNHFQVPYGHTNGIEVAVSKNCAVITVHMKKDYHDCYKGSYFEGMVKECIKRIALIHVLKYSQEIKIKSVAIEQYERDNLINSSDVTDMFIFYPLTRGIISKKMPDIWKKDSLIERVLKQRKTEYSSKMSALYAYIYSKSKEYAIEKFMYLWMAFNGFYAYRFPEGGDKQKMNKLVQKYQLGNSILKQENRNAVGKRVMLLLDSYTGEISKKKFECKELEKLSADITIILEQYGGGTKMKPYGYLLTDFAYFLRCNVFHANKPLLLYCFEDDMELKCVHIVNRLLEDFLDEELCKCFQN